MQTANLLLDYNLGWANLTSSTTLGEASYSSNLALDAVIPGIPLHLREVLDTKTVEQEIRLVSKRAGRLDWVAGAFLLHQHSDQQDVLYLSTPFVQALAITGLPTNVAPGSAYSNDLETKGNFEAAVFGEANYRLTETLKLTAGVRVTDTNFTDTFTGQGYTAPDIYTALFTGGHTNLALVSQTPAQYGTGDTVKAAPKVSLAWQPTGEMNYYLTVSEGFRRGQPNGVEALNGGKSLVDPKDPTIIPASAAGDSLWNFEAGAKTLWFDGRLRANLAAYYIDWTNMQVPLERASDASIYVGNIGQARSVGVEGEFEARPTRALDAGLNFTLQDARVTSITAQQALISGAVRGSKLSSPGFKMGGFLRYDWSLGRLGGVFARVDAQYLGGFANGFPNLPGVGGPSPTYAIVPAYGDVDLSLGWSKDKVGATLYAENLLDNHSPIFINPANYSFNRYGTLRPRTVGLRLSWKY
jgi:outer membrane receptor protein involved in Fe transport